MFVYNDDIERERETDMQIRFYTHNIHREKISLIETRTEKNKYK